MSARVFTIPPGLPFLPTLAREILAGRIVPGVALGGDPLALADLTVYVPTRRAALSLTAAFAHALGGAAAILPSVRTLGEEDPREAFLSDSGAALLPTVDPFRRRLELARLVRIWKSRVESGSVSALLGQAVVLPASAADALLLAEDLATLLDEAADEEVSLDVLASLPIVERLAEWWQLTLLFLEILTREWPRHLSELGLAEAGEQRRAASRERARRFTLQGSRGPVVVAGSTATAPATILFKRAVAELANGAVVLPGLDRHLDETSFRSLTAERRGAVAGHPQFAMARILAGLGTEREAVRELSASVTGRARQLFLTEALRPAETTDLWSQALPAGTGTLDGIALLEAPDERREALACAVAMREALGDPAVRVALVTPDRQLARRVVAELERFGVEANDSAGRPLTATPPGRLARLLLETALRPGDPVTLLSLLKHPLARFGLSAVEARRAARALEILALRGGSGRAEPRGLADLLRARRESRETRKAPRAVRLLPATDEALAERVALALAEATQPLAALRDAPAVEMAVFAPILAAALERIATDENGRADALWAEESGAALAELLAELTAAPPVDFQVPASEWPDVFATLAGEIAVKPRGGLSQRAFVWGALEARLQDVDVAVLAGLNEGIWPQAARSDAFLSRLMRHEILLDPPERRIGLAAHDFWMLMGTPRVVLTRSLRSGGAPTIGSRWLQRILALAGPGDADAMRARGRRLLLAAEGLDEPVAVPRASRPSPRPPVANRPRQFSVTEVERLFRDPYAVYAKRVLRLQPLDPMIRAPDAAERGTLFHAILAAFARGVADPGSEEAEAAFLPIAREEFDRAALAPEIEAVWWPRVVLLARHIVKWERERGPLIAERYAERRGRLLLPDIAVELTGEADRIDRLRDGTLHILDFKTGSQPSRKQARTLLAPQLALEAAMARRGAFEGIAAGAAVAELSFVRLREREFLEETLSQAARGDAPAITADGLADEAFARFRALAAHMLDPATGFLSRARPMRSGDFTGPFDHLARAREWSIGDDEDQGEDGA